MIKVMNRLIVESDSDPYTNSPTGVGFVDLECGELRFYNSNTITVQASGSSDKRNSYVTANEVQTPVLPPILSIPENSDIGYYYQAGFSTIDGTDTIYLPNDVIPVNFGDTTIYSNIVNVIDVDGDGSEFRVDTPGTYTITARLPTQFIMGNLSVMGLTLNGSVIPYSITVFELSVSRINCSIDLEVGDIITVINVLRNAAVKGTHNEVRLYSSILFKKLN